MPTNYFEVSCDNHIYGVFAAETPEEAYDAMNRDAGYETRAEAHEALEFLDNNGKPLVGIPHDVTIVPVAVRDQLQVALTDQGLGIVVQVGTWSRRYSDAEQAAYTLQSYFNGEPNEEWEGENQFFEGTRVNLQHGMEVYCPTTTDELVGMLGKVEASKLVTTLIEFLRA